MIFAVCFPLLMVGLFYFKGPWREKKEDAQKVKEFISLPTRDGKNLSAKEMIAIIKEFEELEKKMIELSEPFGTFVSKNLKEKLGSIKGDLKYSARMQLTKENAPELLN
jgi:hypothetical protein